tara:strand:+ start:592 stop:924 length:333 start_codon:yes stop_codon:yes gene_type:complete
MLWYAYSIGEDNKQKYRYDIENLEYLASFWNAEAVKKIRANRDMTEDERFASDEEFSQILENKDFLRTDEDIRSIIEEAKNTNLLNKEEDRYKVVRPPKDMKGLFDIIKK